MSDKPIAKSTLPDTEQDLVTYADGALAGMQKQVLDHMSRLNARQREFIRHFAAGVSLTQAALNAGYTGQRVDVNASRLLRENEDVMALLSLMREMDGLKYGFPSEWKRAELLDLYGAARDKDQLSVANQVLKSMLELDGDIKSAQTVGAGSVTIKVVTGIDAVIEEAEEAQTIDIVPDSITWENDPST